MGGKALSLATNYLRVTDVTTIGHLYKTRFMTFDDYMSEELQVL